MQKTTFTALAEPNRLRIIELLRERPYSVGEIAKRLALRQPQVSKHLRVLSDAGLVEVYAMAQSRIYTLKPEPFVELEQWLDTFRRMWEARFNRLDEVLQRLKENQAETSN